MTATEATNLDNGVIGYSRNQVGVTMCNNKVHIFYRSTNDDHVYHAIYDPFAKIALSNKMLAVTTNRGVSACAHQDGTVTAVFAESDNRIGMVHYKDGTYSGKIDAPSGWTSAHNIDAYCRGEEIIFAWRSDNSNIHLGSYNHLYDKWRLFDTSSLQGDCSGPGGPAIIDLNEYQQQNNCLVESTMICWGGLSGQYGKVQYTILDGTSGANNGVHTLAKTQTYEGISLTPGKGVHQVMLGLKASGTGQRELIYNIYDQAEDYKSGKWHPRISTFPNVKSAIGPRLITIGNTVWGFYVEDGTGIIKYFEHSLG